MVSYSSERAQAKRMESRRTLCLTLLLGVILFVNSAPCSAQTAGRERYFTASGRNIAVEFDSQLRSRVIAKMHGETVLGQFHESEFLTLGGGKVPKFAFSAGTVHPWEDSLGKGKLFEITARSGSLTKKVVIVNYDAFPTMLLYKVTYKNIGKTPLEVESWVNNNYAITPRWQKGDSVALWSYQPGSYGWDNDWILPLHAGYSRDNYLGMTYADYGGGTPVVDIWRHDCGVAVGHVEKVPKLVSLPVAMTAQTGATLGITNRDKHTLRPGDTLATLRTFVQVHEGDHFNSLTVYRHFMERQGIAFKQAPDGAYESIWCGWGYEQNFTMEEILNTLPKVKEVGLEWVVLDMGWFDTMGDFELPKDKFPHGEADMKKFVDTVHSFGLKLQLWWMPLAASPKSRVFADHPDYLLLNEDGSPRYMPSFFKSFYLCPASKDVQEYSRQQVARFFSWGVDGLKIDGNNLNSGPLCYNPAHHHARPEESVEALPAFHKAMYEEALRDHPQAVIEICPCGTNQSFFILPYMNQTVASDPHTSWHVRLKGKTLNALTGGTTAYFGDHVELSDGKCDFASTVGVGGVVGTKFVYPPGVHMNTESGDVSLTPEKEVVWKKWVKIYRDNMLSKGTYRGELYDIGFDRPEIHAIQKGDTMYYAIYAQTYEGQIALRGLGDGKYRVIDYENDIPLGEITGASNMLKVSFKQHLLIRAVPE